MIHTVSPIHLNYLSTTSFSLIDDISDFNFYIRKAAGTEAVDLRPLTPFPLGLCRKSMLRADLLIAEDESIRSGCFFIALVANRIFTLQAMYPKRNPLCSTGDTTSLTCSKISLRFLTRNRRETRSNRAFLRDQETDLLAQRLYDHVLEYLPLRGWPRYQVCVIDRHRSTLQKLAARNPSSICSF